MGIVQLDEVGVQRARQGPIGVEQTGRLDVDREVVAGRIAGERQPVLLERAGQAKWRAVRVVERPGYRAAVLRENQLQRKVLDRECPVAGDGLLFRLDRTCRED